HAIYHNTPRVRAKRLRKLVSLVHRYGIANLIINRSVEYDKNFDEFLNLLKTQYPLAHQSAFISRDVLLSKHLFFSVDVFNRKVSILYNHHHAEPYLKKLCAFMKNSIKRVNGQLEDMNARTPLALRSGLHHRYSTLLTRHFGLNSSFCISGKWIDSSYAKWVVTKDTHQLHIRLEWPHLPIVQEWAVQCSDGNIQWNVKTWFNEDADITQIKAGIYLSGDYIKYLFMHEWYDLPACFDSDWHDIFLPTLSTMMRSDNAGNNLPDVKITVAANKDIALQVQTAPADLTARMINVCCVGDSLLDRTSEQDKRKELLFTKEKPLLFNVAADFLNSAH
ncbi:MAG: hypothetical protein KKH94_08960, partial [Candidatus Omnitrophica bacterium]|nr:hypothetical protein [Candidatus Omnitrophota bacterium]